MLHAASRVSLVVALALPGSLSLAAEPAGQAAAPASQEASSEINEGQRLVFMNELMGNVPAGSVLEYSFTSSGKDRESFADRVKVRVSRVADDGRRDLQFDFLTGTHRLDFHPATAYKGNPVPIHFLERDISELSKETGGDIGYFRNRIRHAFAHPQIQPAKIALNGQELDGMSVSVVPFVDDPNKERFPAYANKRYDFVFSDRIPGGLYRIHTTVPGEAGGAPVVEEDLIFKSQTPGG